jgi:hypothetical protein
MPDVSNSQEPTRYTFRDAHRPTLTPGSYTLTAKWTITVDGERQEHSEETTDFWVAGERFWLKPADIQAMYPPAGSRGDYTDSLPHIVLARDTLPWERSAKGPEAPWLALLLLNAQEAAACHLQTLSVSAYRQSLPPRVEFRPEPGHEDSDQVQVIELSATLSRALLPDLQELSLLCHVRTREGSDPPESVAVVVSKRLPHPGRNTVHLVSLESRYLGNDFDAANLPTCTLITLKSWTFFCEPTHIETESLDGLFARLRPGWLQLSPPADGMAQRYLSWGCVPLPHRFRTGESGVSWYAGSLVPNRPWIGDVDPLKLPARSADELLWYDEEIGMLNIGYAGPGS